MSKDDEITLNVLLAEGIDFPTALAALPDDRPAPPCKPANIAAQIGGLVGGLAFIIYWYFLR